MITHELLHGKENCALGGTGYPEAHSQPAL